MSARVTDFETEAEIRDFAKAAAAWFADNPEGWTYSDSNQPEPGEFLALRWGLGGDCVMVFRVGEMGPVIYGQAIERGDPTMTAGGHRSNLGSTCDRPRGHAGSHFVSRK